MFFGLTNSPATFQTMMNTIFKDEINGGKLIIYLDDNLGMIVSHNTVRMDPAKVQAVVEWPEPRHKQDVQEFLGFMNFYRRFICLTKSSRLP